MKTIFIVLAGASLFAGCGKSEEQGSADVDPDVVTDIQWFDGSVDAAFAAAKKAGKPIYLYWGAEWCPPCHAIKATVFKSPEFIERSRLFVPVYLDGDTENAQAAGERFGVLGYPTMIVFDADGGELTRIPGGIDMQAYANVLDLTLSNSASTANLVERVLAEAPLLSPAECKQLAYYSWGQDPVILSTHDESAAFRRMYEVCPAELDAERSILYFNWLDAKLDTLDAEDKAEVINADEKREAVGMVTNVLNDYQLTRSNVFPVIFSGARYTAALTEPESTARDKMTARFYAAFDALFNDETLYKRERLYTLAGKIDFERMDDEEAELSDALVKEIIDAVAWADESTPSKYERQPIINAIGNILDDAGMDDLARKVFTAELEISEQPYYFMVDLAHVEQRSGNHKLALDWLKKAWDTSTGTATRFQWGNYYLAGLIEMTPADSQRIHETTVKLFTELQAGSGFYQRPKSQLSRLETRLREWSEEYGTGDDLAAIRESVVAVCALDAHAESRERCSAFLDAA